MDFLKKIRKLKKGKRKIIFWLIIGLVVVLLSSFFIFNAKRKIESFQGENILEEMGLQGLENSFQGTFLPANIEELIRER